VIGGQLERVSWPSRARVAAVRRAVCAKLARKSL
jgi:hypothetical protein